MKNLYLPFWVKIILFYCLIALAFMKNINSESDKSNLIEVVKKDTLDKANNRLSVKAVSFTKR